VHSYDVFAFILGVVTWGGLILKDGADRRSLIRLRRRMMQRRQRGII
jgi:hypothetical protein